MQLFKNINSSLTNRSNNIHQRFQMFLEGYENITAGYLAQTLDVADMKSHLDISQNRATPKPSISFSDFPFWRVQLLGYPQPLIGSPPLVLDLLKLPADPAPDSRVSSPTLTWFCSHSWAWVCSLAISVDWSQMGEPKNTGTPSHYGCFNTKLVIHDLDDLGYHYFRNPPNKRTSHGADSA